MKYKTVCYVVRLYRRYPLYFNDEDSEEEGETHATKLLCSKEECARNLPVFFIAPQKFDYFAGALRAPHSPELKVPLFPEKGARGDLKIHVGLCSDLFV